MTSPLLSRPASPEEIRRQIGVLEREIDSIRNRRDGAIRALADRRQKKARLESQLALCESSDRAPAQPALCPA